MTVKTPTAREWLDKQNRVMRARVRVGYRSDIDLNTNEIITFLSAAFRVKGGFDFFGNLDSGLRGEITRYLQELAIPLRYAGPWLEVLDRLILSDSGHPRRRADTDERQISFTD